METDTRPDGRPTTELPRWDKLRRPDRAHAATSESRSPEDEALLDMVCSSGWMTFVRDIVAAKAKPIHHSLVAGVFARTSEMEARVGAIKVLDEVFTEAYKRAGSEYPEYLRMLLRGEIA
jgi:hypothetical protein